MNARILIASPSMKDPVFGETVVLVWHHDAEGAIGVVVNREVPETLPDILDTVPDGVDMSVFSKTHVAWGGPVETQAGTVIVNEPIASDVGWNLQPNLSVSRSMDVLNDLLRHPRPFLLCLGYAGWGPGQLDDEIVAGGWLFTDLDADLVFQVPNDERYDHALASLGLSRHTAWMSTIDE